MPNYEGSWADCPDQFNKAGCVLESGECQPWVFTTEDDPEQVRGWRPQIAVDGGVRDYATGEAVLNADGVPVAYTVGSGDVIDFVRERFCLNSHYLYAINHVRRDSRSALFVGDTLNLDAHTILTVGSQNGVIYDNKPPSVIPPQR
jgi:hypothetical protein